MEKRTKSEILLGAAACFGGGIGPALMDAFDADSAGEEELIRMAERWGIDVSAYEL